MTTSTDRTAYRALVADVAARAKAILPQAVNGRVERAVKLVLVGDVQPQEDGTVLVGSSSDPTRTYQLVGANCTCRDFVERHAPGEWCQHRIAAAIAKRVQELLPLAPEPLAPLGEAPASVNVRLTIGGREVQVTLRGTDEAEVLTRLEAVLARYPQTQPAARPVAPVDATPQCPTHGALKKSTKGKGWYCPTRLDDDTWCQHKGT
jgi:hypothetical protein